MKSFLETCLLNLFADESLKKSYKICSKKKRRIFKFQNYQTNNIKAFATQFNEPMSVMMTRTLLNCSSHCYWKFLCFVLSSSLRENFEVRK